MYCQACCNLNPQTTLNDPKLSVFLDEVEAQKQRGCRFCTLLCGIVETFMPDWQKAFVALGLSVEAYEGKPIKARLDGIKSFKHVADVEIAGYLQIYSPTGTAIPSWPSLGAAREISDHSGSNECFEFIEDQFQQCVTQHGEFCRQPSLTILPKRVIDIGNKRVCLFEPVNAYGRYAALSYSWGNNQTMKTTAASIQQLKQGIDFDFLPPTLKDAIFTARRLSIWYIWIDCLCIIQDSQADWEVESSKMCEYYENAYITIAASSSASVQTPFLSRRPHTFSPKELRFEDGRGGFSTVKVRRQRKPDDCGNFTFGPLSERAWTFQENILSSRILHYTETEVIWECRTAMISEDGHPLDGRRGVGLAHTLSSEIDNHPWKCWFDLVEAYSRRNLTFDTDKLPALSGVAAKIHSSTGSQYYAGLWKHNLEEHLLWFLEPWPFDSVFVPDINYGPKPVPLLCKNAVPSWSWASMNGAVLFWQSDGRGNDTSQLESNIVIEDVHCPAAGLGRFGEVGGGSLKVTGMLLPITVNSDTPTDSLSYTMSLASHGKHLFYPDTVLEEVEANSSDSQPIRTLMRCSVTEGHGAIHAQAACLIIGRSYTGIARDFRTYGLILGQSNTYPGAYSRLGLVILNNRDFQEKFQRETITIV